MMNTSVPRVLSRTLKILLLLTLFLTSFAGTDDYVRVTLDQPAASPFWTIRYEVTKRRPATTAVHRRLLPGHSESLHSLGLLTAKETAAIDALIEATAAVTLADAAPDRPLAGALTWTVEVMVDGKRHAFRATDPENLKDRRYIRLIDGVREAVVTITGKLPFRNVFFSPKSLGWLNITSFPSARVFIDGFDTQQETPLYSYELKAGGHEVRLVTPDGRYDRVYNVRVEPSGTTNIRVDLR